MFDYAGTQAERQIAERDPETGEVRVVNGHIECGECDGIGRYDRVGDVVCEDCGLVLSDQPGMIPQDYSGSRGFESGESRDRYSELEQSERATRGPTELL